MRKSEFVAAVAKKAEMSQREIEKAMDAICDVIVETSVNNGEEVHMPFGIFKQKVNKAKKGINPLNKKPIDVPESHSLAFKPSKTIKVVIGAKVAKKPTLKK